MLRFLISLLIILCGAAGLHAQDATTFDFVVSDAGFTIKRCIHPIFAADGYAGRDTYSIGLYSADGKTLVSAVYTYNASFAVAYGTETIAPRAFQALSGCNITIPSTVKAISPDALPSAAKVNIAEGSSSQANRIVAIYDDATEVQTSSMPAVNADGNGKSKIYDLQGRHRPEPVTGVNIVTLPDGTAIKEFRK